MPEELLANAEGSETVKSNVQERRYRAQSHQHFSLAFPPASQPPACRYVAATSEASFFLYALATTTAFVNQA